MKEEAADTVRQKSTQNNRRIHCGISGRGPGHSAARAGHRPQGRARRQGGHKVPDSDVCNGRQPRTLRGVQEPHWPLPHDVGNGGLQGPAGALRKRQGLGPVPAWRTNSLRPHRADNEVPCRGGYCEGC